MSIEAINFAMKAKIKKSSIKFVLFCVANYANEDGEAYPSIARVQEITSLDRKTVIAAMAFLCENGFLLDTGLRRGRTGQIPVYQLVSGDAMACQGISKSPENGTVSKSPVFPIKESQKRDTEPKGEPPVDSSLRSESSETLFGNAPAPAAPVSNFPEFYLAYPRRTAKLAAERSYLKAIKKGVPHATILAAAKAYAVACAGKDPAYIKHPATWLNGGCWDDEQPAGGQFAAGNGGGYAGRQTSGRREPPSVVEAALRAAARYSN